MYLNIENYFLNRTKNLNSILNEIDYIKFIDLTLQNKKFYVVYYECVKRQKIKNSKMLKKFLYHFYCFIVNKEIMFGLFWNIKFQQSRKCIKKSVSDKKGTIVNFIYMNQDSINFNIAQFRLILKFLYIIWKNKQFGKILKNQFYKFYSISIDDLNDLIDNYNMDIKLISALIKIPNIYRKIT